MKGIDISQHNGTIDFNKVKKEVEFVILRLGWIGNNNNHTLDTKFDEYYTSCKSLNIPVGIYVFNYAKTESNAISGAVWTINQLKGKSIDLPIYIDMENDDSSSFKMSSLGKDKLTNIAVAFNTEIEKAGYSAGVYSNADWYKNYLNKDLIKSKYTTWVAHYGISEDKYNGQYDMLQYTSSGKISGIKGNVDLNKMYKVLINTNTPSNPNQALKSIDEVANDVINGAWSNGEKRKELLTKAGYDYNAVQNKVNEILSNKPNTTENVYYPKCNSRYASLIDALKSIGVNSSFDYRRKIAQKNGVNHYIGTSTQNLRLLTKLKAGKLLKV